MPKNYYLILGIRADASLEEIKKAYRRLVKKFHPDCYGENGRPFLNIQKAYSVLSDPLQRETYDHQLEESRREQERVQRPAGGRPAWQEVEPLIPERGQPEMFEASLARSFNYYRPSFDQLFDRLFRNFLPKSSPKNEKIEELTVVITLTPEQAFTGGHVRLMVPARLSCPGCHGKGGRGGFECLQCGGEAFVTGEQAVLIKYPAKTPDNHTIQMSLDRFGIHNLYLTVQFRISENL